jgi:uncharacterized membrane protein
MAHSTPWQHIRFVVQQVAYDLRHGLLFRPLAWTISLAVAGLVLPWLDGQAAVRAWLPPWLDGGEAGTAQTQLATIASAMMTTLSVVYSVLVVALTLASVQFSPRLLGRFLGAAASQNTIGCFVGTFVYCLLVLRAVRSEGEGLVPVVSLTVALLLALLSLALLIYAIDALAKSIQANHIAADIATETQTVLDMQLDAAATAAQTVRRREEPPLPPPEAVAVPSPVSGYLQLIAVEELAALANQGEMTVLVVARPGRFVLAGEPLAWLWPPSSQQSSRAADIQSAFDIGSVRTLQQDAEFGFRQLVDMALKAISPAVNDPSTACTCIDHLTALLCHAVRRDLQSPRVPLPQPQRARAALYVPRIDSAELIDLAVQQLRQYGSGDVAVCLRLARLLAAVDSVALRPADRARLRHHARWIDEQTQQRIEADDRVEMVRRLQPLLADPAS